MCYILATLFTVRFILNYTIICVTTIGIFRHIHHTFIRILATILATHHTISC